MSFFLAGAALVGTVVSSRASSSAADKQSEATRAASEESTQLLREQFGETKETLDPYIQAGVPAIDRQQALLGLQGQEAQTTAFDEFQTSPAFDWQRDQIIGNVNRGAAAGGMKQSGNRLAALTDRLQGLYSQEYNNYLNQLGAQSGIGLSAASALGGVGQSSAVGQANIINQAGQNIGAAQAQGTLGVASSIGSGLSDIAGVYANRQGSPVKNMNEWGWQGQPQVQGGFYG
jgi:hypothetical protein